ncbi:MAG: hypothetical protein HY514_00100 [Candidatus Aenigmarchaeota archaeon]|nr:hypothetical protein [Candidatus Aenigmarchaeota archaeon]
MAASEKTPPVKEEEHYSDQDSPLRVKRKTFYVAATVYELEKALRETSSGAIYSLKKAKGEQVVLNRVAKTVAREGGEGSIFIPFRIYKIEEV